MSFADLEDPKQGFLVDDTLIIEAEVTLLGLFNDSSKSSTVQQLFQFYNSHLSSKLLSLSSLFSLLSIGLVDEDESEEECEEGEEGEELQEEEECQGEMEGDDDLSSNFDN
ncbi:hypothetical protein LWI29_027651 [Acer saccharum]|uniref:MATH domain-containing protein n=1 Tax=Acer saccharum TaxID=4024 RepID=A0AA39SXE1_ACESA|nr:hypothetical protein LWI29_027651 [Acer saccharum]